MRVAMITRTIKTVTVDCLMVNEETAETFFQSITLPGRTTDNKKIMKLLTAMFENEPVKPVSIKSVTVETDLYGQTEAEFIKNGSKLPPRKTKN